MIKNLKLIFDFIFQLLFNYILNTKYILYLELQLNSKKLDIFA